MKSKQCIKCNINKVLTEFNRDNKKNDKHKNVCRVCDNMRKSQRVQCECGSMIRRDGIAKHKRTNIHKRKLNKT